MIASKRTSLIEMDLIEDKIIQRFLPELRRRMALYPVVGQSDSSVLDGDLLAPSISIHTGYETH